MSSVRIACIQFTPGDELNANVETILSLAQQAIEKGAQLLLLPEYASGLHASGRVMRELARSEVEHPLVAALQRLAREHLVWVLAGSVVVPADGGDDSKMANRSLLIDQGGKIVARYDKLHMFDATLPNGREIRESSAYQAGTSATVAATPWGLLGMSICYDVRFPDLYRKMAQAGASFLAIPAAFTAATGAMHWEALIRARAIENQCYVFAPATCGVHPSEHATHGHSLVVDPWGRVLADAGSEPGVIVVDVDGAQVLKARGMIPSLQHTREFDVCVIDS